MPLLGAKKTCQRALGAESNPHRQPAIKHGPQSYTNKEMISATSLTSLEVDSPPGGLQMRAQLANPLVLTL